MSAERIVQISGTTTSASEDIMTFLKTKTDLASDTESLPFRLSSIYFEATADTNIKVNNAPEWSDLRQDLIDGLFKCETLPNEVLIRSFVVQGSGISYFCRFTY